MVKKQVKVYEYFELSEVAKENAVNNHIDILSELSCQDLRDYVKYDLQDKGIDEINLYFDLSYSQGSGLCFEFCLFGDELVNFLRMNFPDISVKEKMIDELDITVKSTHSGNYYHSYSCIPIVTAYNAESLRQENYIDYLQRKIENWYHDICREYEKIGYELFEYDEEYLQDFFQDNLFYSDGRLYHE